MPPDPLPPAWRGAALAKQRRRVLRWFDEHGRHDLPWRRTHDPYHVWLSEIMLQQTTVAAVVPYFERFLTAFPTVAALASAPEADVLRLWEGLGYYRRARMLHRAAQTVMTEHAGRFPESLDALLALPGVGRYTAGAIASFAFGIAAPIVEANTLRLYARLLGYRDDPKASAGQTALWNFAERIVPNERPGDFNLALMDLGASVCTPLKPNCEACPLQDACAARAANLQQVIPAASPKPVITSVVEAALVVRRGDGYLLRRRGPQERWAGLWDFPRFAVPDEHLIVAAAATPLKKPRRPPRTADRSRALFPEVSETESAGDNAAPLLNRLLTATGIELLEQQLRDVTGVAGRLTSCFHEIRHSVTRYRIRLLCLTATDHGGAPLSNDVAWIAPADLPRLPLSTTGRKLAELLATW